MGHIKRSGLKGAGVGATLAVVLIGGTMWRLNLWSAPRAVGAGEINILWNLLPYLAAIVIGAFGVVGGVFEIFIGWCDGPGEEPRHPRKDSRHPLE